MKLLCDMGVSPKVAAWLREAGHDVVHLRDEQLHRMADPDIFAKAAAEGRALLTFEFRGRRGGVCNRRR